MLIHALQLSHISSRKKKEKRSRGRPYTDREQKIIDGEYVRTLRRLDVTKLIWKAQDKGDQEIAEKLEEMYDDLLYDDNYYIPKDIIAIEGGPGITHKDAMRAFNKAVNKEDGKAIQKLSKLYDIPLNDSYYTQYEQEIINGKCTTPFGPAAVTRIMNKALQVDDFDVAEQLADMYDDLLNPIQDRKYTLEEANAVLDRLNKEYAEKHKK